LGTTRSWRDVNSPRNRKRWHKLSSTGLRWDDGDLCGENEKGEWWPTGERSGDGDDDAYRGEARTALGQRRCLNRVFIPTANGAWTPPSWTANPGMTRGDREADRRAPRGS
jgi:hypothetical protein